ncbi:unnamed protein product [Lota lota]
MASSGVTILCSRGPQDRPCLSQQCGHHPLGAPRTDPAFLSSGVTILCSRLSPQDRPGLPQRFVHPAGIGGLVPLPQHTTAEMRSPTDWWNMYSFIPHTLKDQSLL